MKPRVLNIRTLKREGVLGKTPGIFIGRPSPFGNPFKIGRDGTRAQVIEKYRVYLSQKPDLVEKARRELKGQNLLCFCAPDLCHGDVLLALVNSHSDSAVLLDRSGC